MLKTTQLIKGQSMDAYPTSSTESTLFMRRTVVEEFLFTFLLFDSHKCIGFRIYDLLIMLSHCSNKWYTIRWITNFKKIKKEMPGCL